MTSSILKSLRISKKFRGISLIEVLVAMVVLAIGLLGLAGITNVTMRTNALSQQTAKATNIANSILEAVGARAPSVRCAAIANPGACTILSNAGLAANNAYLPTTQNDSCGLENVLDSSGLVRTFDTYMENDSDLVGFVGGDKAANARVCDVTSVPSGQFLRYYRVYDPSDSVAGTGASTTRSIIAVVLWQDRFGSWRHVKATRIITP